MILFFKCGYKKITIKYLCSWHYIGQLAWNLLAPSINNTFGVGPMIESMMPGTGMEAGVVSKSPGL
jgi:hypothetical protein